MGRGSKIVSGRMPVVFIGHGNPMNAIEDNRWSREFEKLGRDLPTPNAFLCISAHWYGPGTHITGNERPSTIHDFGGFPKELFNVQYPAPGNVEVAERLNRRLERFGASVSLDWGLDHGAWSILRHLRPTADIPVLQLSIDRNLSAPECIEVGRSLSELRDEGIVILGSGKITHNLRDALLHYGHPNASTPTWAAQFDADITAALEQHEPAFLAKVTGAAEFRQSHPTPDHYLPLLYAVGASQENDRISFPITGFDMGSLSMRAVRFDRES